MMNLYKIKDTNSEIDNEKQIKKIDVIYDLKDGYTISDTDNKNIVCICGYCEMLLQKNEVSQTIFLNSPNKTIQVKKNVLVKFLNPSKDLKIGIEHYDLIENL